MPLQPVLVSMRFAYASGAFRVRGSAFRKHPAERGTPNAKRQTLLGYRQSLADLKLSRVIDAVCLEQFGIIHFEFLGDARWIVSFLYHVSFSTIRNCFLCSISLRFDRGNPRRINQLLY